MDYLHNKQTSENSKIGTMFILLWSSTSIPRYLKQNHLDSRSVVNDNGKPDSFITMTCNSNWKKITENMKECGSTSNRPDTIASVFD